jgi:arsenate reductase
VATTPKVVFLCVQNAGRSQMAAAWADQLSGGLVDAESAGSAPADGVHPNVVAAMSEVGIDLSSVAPARWSESMLHSADVVITMGCGDACPVVPGVRYLDWDVVDPHGADLDTVRAVRDDLRQRVDTLLGELDTAHD